MNFYAFLANAGYFLTVGILIAAYIVAVGAVSVAIGMTACSTCKHTASEEAFHVRRTRIGICPHCHSRTSHRLLAAVTRKRENRMNLELAALVIGNVGECPQCRKAVSVDADDVGDNPGSEAAQLI